MTSTLAVSLVATTRAAITAHEAAAAYHEAMAEALRAEDELAGDAEFTDVPYYTKQYEKYAGRAVAMLQRMPLLWAAAVTMQENAK